MRSTIVAAWLVRGLIAACLLWQMLGRPGVPRTLQNTREWKLVLLNQAGRMVAVAPTCELAAIHRLMMGQRGMALLIVPASAAFDAAVRDDGGKASVPYMLPPPAQRLPAMHARAVWHAYAVPCRQGIPLRQWRYG